MLKEVTAPLEEVAEALGIKPTSLKRRSRILHNTKGFPLPLPGGGWRWSSRAVTAWIAAAGSTDGQPLEQEDEDEPEADNRLLDNLVRQQNADLRLRYGGVR